MTVTLNAELVDFTSAGDAWRPTNTIFTASGPSLPFKIPSNVTFNNASAATIQPPPGFTVNNLTIAGNVTLWPNGSTTTVNGNLATTASGKLRMASATDIINVTGDATFNSGITTNGSLTNGVLTIGGNFQQSNNSASFSATGSHRTVLKPSAANRSVSFANPDSTPSTSHFANLEISNALGAGTVSNALATNIVAIGQLLTVGTPTAHRMLNGAGHTMLVAGASADSIQFDNLPVLIGPSQPFSRFAKMVWQNMGVVAIQLSILRNADGLGYSLDTPKFPITNPTPPGKYLIVGSANGPGSPFSVSISNATPFQHAGFAAVGPTGNATFSGWNP